MTKFLLSFSISILAQTDCEIHAPLLIVTSSTQVTLVPAPTILYYFSPIARLSGRAPPIDLGELGGAARRKSQH